MIDCDATAVEFRGYSEGAALGAAPGMVYTVTEAAPGQLVITILPPAGGLGVATACNMMTLSLRVLKFAVTGLTFRVSGS